MKDSATDSVNRSVSRDGVTELTELTELTETDALHVEPPPPLPASVFADDGALPAPLREACLSFEEPFARDLFLLGWLPVFSSACPHVLTRYGRAWKEMCLLSVVVAEAGSGKSAFARASEVAEALNQRLMEEAKDAKDAYDLLDKEEKERRPEPPKTRLLFAADSSMRAIGDALVDNSGRGLIFDTEIAEVARTLKSDWGNFTTLLLKSFEQEAYTRDRKDEAFIHVRRPAVSVGLTGTPRSFVQLVPDEESGLFSRLLTYTFRGGADWVDQFGEFEDPLDTYIAELGADADAIHAALSGRPVDPKAAVVGDRTPLYLRLTREQQLEVNRTMGTLFRDTLIGGRGELAANVKRSALMAVRVAGLLAVYRIYLASGRSGLALSARTDAIYPTDAEVDAALDIVHVGIEHAARLALRWSTDPTAKIADEGRRHLYDALPDDFRTAEAAEVGAELGMSRSGVERALRAFKKLGLFEPQATQGHYVKRRERPARPPSGDGTSGPAPEPPNGPIPPDTEAPF